jgi:tetratricopeptide (TPR) repeat protein
LLRSVMLSWNYLANCYRRLDGPASPKVAEAYEKLTAIAERLAAFDPEDFTARYDLAMSLQRLGLFYSETGRPDQALQPAEKSAAIMRGLAKQNALTMSRARNFVQSLLTLGSIHQGGKRTAEAAAAWGEALTTAESLLEAEPRDPNTLMAASRASLYLARGAAGQAALDMAHKSVSFAERLVAAGSTPTREGWLAQARGMAALTLAKGNQRQEATTLAGQSAEAQKRLPPQAFPDWPQAERAEVLALAGQAGPTASN